MGYTHGQKWDDAMTEAEIRNVMSALCIDRMPSNNEIKIVAGCGLGCHIGKHGGFRYWANKLNLPTKESATKTGNGFEVVAKELLTSKGYSVIHMSTKHPYDLLVNDGIKIDVKVAKPYSYAGNSTFHTFNLEKKNSTCDIYMMFILDFEENIKKLLIIPGFALKITQLSVGKQSIYDKYLNRWDIVESYAMFYRNMQIKVV
jgi:hypothetical protein